MNGPDTCPLRQFLAAHRPDNERGFDHPCECGHASSNCTKKADGTCD